jgi:sigma-B regulation protein RsbU (phosphoserine phosphatase)
LLTDKLEQEQSMAERVARVIFEHASRISREQDLSTLIRMNADLARDLVGAERCSLWLIDESTGELWTRVAHGLEEVRISKTQGIAGACLAQNRPIVVNDVPADESFFRHIDDVSGYITRSTLCVPVMAENKLIGTLQVLNKPGGFSPEDVELLRLTAVYASSGIQAEWYRNEAISAELLKRELEMAAEVQRRLLPQRIDNIHNIEFAGFCRPARFVGGDYYDFMELPAPGFGFALGDVSGKGFPAAVLMASIHTLLRFVMATRFSNLPEAVAEVNDTVYRSSAAERYSTLFCGVLDPVRHELRYVNAGHLPPYIIRKEDGVIERPSGSDLPVGLLPGVSYQQHVVAVRPGDLVVCISDGISEAHDKNGEMWELSNVEATLREYRNKPVQEIAQALIDAVDQYASGAEQFDDMTVLVVR